VELFSIMLSVPAAFVLSMVYCALLAKTVCWTERVRRVMHFDNGNMHVDGLGLDRLRRLLYVASLILLGLFLIELVLLTALGTVRSRAVFGRGGGMHRMASW
jgi:hypothetical protein